MRVVVRYFFRTVRVILTPVMLVSEKLSTPKPISRSPEVQAGLDKDCEKLALYQLRACPFCIRVRKQMARLGLKVEKRDARDNDEHRSRLESEGGRIKVPCLLIERDDGEREWLYESDAINAWLQGRFEPSAS